MSYEMTMEQRDAFSALSDGEQRFSLSVLAGKGDATALRAGWPDNYLRMKAGVIRNRPKVRTFLTAMQSAWVSDAVMTRTEALERLTTIARTTIDDIIETKTVNWGTEEEPDIQVMWQLRDDFPEAMAAVSKISSTSSGPRIEMHSPLNAIKQMADMCGWVDTAPPPGQQGVIESTAIDVTALSNQTLHELVLSHYTRPPPEDL